MFNSKIYEFEPRIVTRLNILFMVYCMLFSVNVVADINDSERLHFEGVNNQSTQILFEQAAFWDVRNRGDLVRLALQRVLNFDPTHNRALYELGLSYSKEGNIEQAINYRKRLLASNPSSEYVALLGDEIKNSTVDKNRLELARQHKSKGNISDALQEYEYLFVGRDVSGPIALEYFHTMSSVSERYRESIAGLEQMLTAKPANREIKFTLAQVLTYQNDTRRRGLDMLRDLSEYPEYRNKAVKKYAEALLWLNASMTDKGYFEFYVNQMPEDERLKNKFQSLRNDIDPNSYDGLVHFGFIALNDGQVETAEKLLTRASRIGRHNADALAGLAIIRQKKGDHASAIQLYEEAFAKDASLQKPYASAVRGARFWHSINTLRSPKFHHNAQAALDLASKMKASNPSEKLELSLLTAELHTQVNGFPEAETIYQQILAINPTEERAILGMVDLAIIKQDFQMLAEIRITYAMLANDSAVNPRLRAGLYRAIALLLAHRKETAQANMAFEKALNIDPDGVWLRFDYARHLLSINSNEKAKSIIQGMPQSTMEDHQIGLAKALYYMDLKDWSQALSLLDTLEKEFAAPTIVELQRMAKFNQDIADALFQGELRGPSVAQDALIAIYESSPDINEAGFLVVSALNQIDRPKAARVIIQQELSSNPSISVGTKLSYAQYLINWKEFERAESLIDELESEEMLGTEERLQLTATNINLMQARGEDAMKRAQYRHASSSLNAALRLEPRNSRTLRMLGQLEQQRGELTESINYYRLAIEIDPRDLWAIKGAVGSALESGNLNVAREVADNALDTMPQEPDVYELISRIAQAAGDSKMAIESMSYAKSLRKKNIQGAP